MANLVKIAGLQMRGSVKNDWISVLYRYAESLQPGRAVIVQVLRNVIVLGLLRQIRKRYLQALPRAMEMSVSGTRLGSVERMVGRTQTGVMVGRLQTAYKTLDSAVLSGSNKRIKAAQEKLDKAKERLVNHLDGRQRASQVALARKAKQTSAIGYLQSKGAMALGAIAGGMFRRSAMLLLTELTSPTTVTDAIVTTDGTMMAAGNITMLDRIQTPSATQLLQGVKSRSKMSVLWRQLEFGTGAYSKFQMGQLSSSRYSRNGKWLYGDPSGGNDRGIYAYGTRPMNFLFPERSSGGSTYHPDDRRVAQEVLNTVMMQFAPLPEHARIF